MGEAVQPARQHHESRDNLLAVAEHQAETAFRPLKPAYPQGLNIGHKLPLEPLAIASEQLERHYLGAGKALYSAGGTEIGEAVARRWRRQAGRGTLKTRDRNAKPNRNMS